MVPVATSPAIHQVSWCFVSGDGSAPAPERSGRAPRGARKARAARRSAPDCCKSAHQLLAEVRENTRRIMDHLEVPAPLPATSAVDGTVLRSVRSIAAMTEATHGLVVADEARGGMRCTLCSRDVVPPQPSAHHQVGVFKYNFNLGTSFAGKDSLPGAFRTLKHAVSYHIRAPRHRKLLQKRLASWKDPQAICAMNVLRAAYFLFRNSGTVQSFSDLITLHILNGLDMGNLDHAKTLLEPSRRIFCDIILANLKNHIAGQPCVTVLVGKVTVNRRSATVVVVLTAVPDAPPGRLVQSFVAGAFYLDDLDSDGVAKRIHEALARVGVRSADQVAAMALSDCYRARKVPLRLLRCMRQAGCRSSAAGLLVMPLREGVPLLSRAEAVARASKSGAWVSRTLAGVGEITERFQSDGGAGELSSAAVAMGLTALPLKSLSETDSLSHKAASLRRFCKNWNVMEAALTKRTAAEPGNLVDTAILFKLKGGRYISMCLLFHP